MDSNPLVNEFIEAALRLLAEYAKVVPIKVAFWLKDPDRTNWDLYVASERYGDGPRQADYLELVMVKRALRQEFHDPHLDQTRIHLVQVDDPAVQAALEVRRQYPEPNPIRLHGRIFGKMYVDGVYIYPPLELADSKVTA